MSAQPLNQEILVYRNVRSFRQAFRQESVAALIKRLRPLVMSIPADEILVEVKSRDTAVSDMSPYMGQARFDGGTPLGRGFPIVIGLASQVSFANAQANLPLIDFGFQIGQDMFLQNTTAGLGQDLQQDARDLTPDV
jgi:hypothetical protein